MSKTHLLSITSTLIILLVNLLPMGCSTTPDYVYRHDVMRASEKQLESYAVNPRKDVRAWVAECPTTPPRLLTQLSEDPELDVILELASNPNTPPEVLSRLSKLDNYLINLRLFEHPELPAKDIVRMVNEGKALKLVEHPNMPFETRIKLALSEDKYVQFFSQIALEREIASQDPKSFPKTVVTPNESYIIVLAEPKTMLHIVDDKEYESPILKRGFYITKKTIDSAEGKKFTLMAHRDNFDNYKEEFILKPGQTYIQRINFEPHPDEKTRVVDLGDGVKIECLWVSPGRFTMGTDKRTVVNDVEKCSPVHDVVLTRGFWMSKTEITQAQYEKVMGSNPSEFKGADLPVDSVNYLEALQFCDTLSKTHKIECSLPTEAQWEYVCRAGEDNPNEPSNKKNLSYEEKEAYRKAHVYYGGHLYGNEFKNKQTQKVASLKPNPWGFYDMSGNVFEWCLDWYSINYGDNKLKVNPTGISREASIKAKAGHPVIRGGSWNSDEYSCHPAARGMGNTYKRWNAIGMRIVIY